MLPSEYAKIEGEEKAMLIAFIDEEIRLKKKHDEEIKRKARIKKR